MTPNNVELDVIDAVIDHFKLKAKTVISEQLKKAYNDFNKLTLLQKREIIAEWVDCQNQAIYECVRAGLPIQVPALGTFKINTPSLIFADFKREVAAEFGYDSYSDCPEDIRKAVNNIAKERQKDVQYERYFKVRKDSRNGEIFDIKLNMDLNI